MNWIKTDDKFINVALVESVKEQVNDLDGLGFTIPKALIVRMYSGDEIVITNKVTINELRQKLGLPKHD